MKQRPLAVLLSGLIAAALFAAGVKTYWAGKDSLAAGALRKALQANYLQPRQGIARTMVSTPRGWIVSLAKVRYSSPGNWQIEYLNPRLAKAKIGHQGGYLWKGTEEALPSEPRPGLARVVSIQTAPTPVAQVEPALANYQVRYLGSDRVAGRPVKIVGLADKASGRLLRVFWIDERSGIMLRWDRLREDGRLISTTQFLNISLIPRPGGEPSIASGAGANEPRVVGVKMGLEELSRKVGFQVLQPGRVPQGFRLEESYFFPCPCGCGGTSAHLRFSDGVRGFSVFEVNEKSGKCPLTHNISANIGQPLAGPSPALRGATARRKGLLIVVIGDLEAEALKEIAGSF